jgi:hypothetical protein
MNPTIYNYHPQSGEFLGTDQADTSPLEPGVFLMPAYATSVVPPAAGARQVAVFDGNGWQLKPDWRGHSYWLADGTPGSITELGVAPPAHALNTPPAPPLHELKAKAIAQMRALRPAVFATLAGLQSEALTLGNNGFAKAVTVLQQRLRDLPTTDLSKCQTQADIEATVKAAWAGLSEGAPPKLIKALANAVA